MYRELLPQAKSTVWHGRLITSNIIKESYTVRPLGVACKPLLYLKLFECNSISLGAWGILWFEAVSQVVEFIPKLGEWAEHVREMPHKMRLPGFCRKLRSFAGHVLSN